MKNKGLWISLCLLNLCVVTLLGLTLRSKALFDLPSIDYNHLLDAHSHFAFGGWVTLALMVLFASVLLTDSQKNQSIYQFVFAGIFVTTWSLLLIFPFTGYNTLSSYISTLFIFTTYIFGWIFIKDIRKAEASKTVLLLSVASVVCLVLSSVGPFTLAYLFATKSLNAVFYRDALFSYLHLQYNGFFTLAVFALLFHKLESKLTVEVQERIYRFSLLLVISILPSMFLSYHWQNPGILIHVIAYSGSILVMLSFIWFALVIRSVTQLYKTLSALMRLLGVLSISAFMLKTFLQSFTIFNIVGNLVFGDRPIIMGFLHLVFLGFVTLFLLAYFAQSGFLNTDKVFTRFSLVVFAVGVVSNEVLLWSQGIGDVFVESSDYYPWLLWGAGILLCVGATLVFIARIRSASTLIQEFGRETYEKNYSSASLDV